MSYVKHSSVQNILISIKYKKRADLAEALGEFLGTGLSGLSADMIIPVPLHKKRMAERGYNQSEMLGQGISTKMRIDCRPDLLIRVKNTVSQTKMKKVDRIKNVEKIFRVKHQKQLIGKHVLLVDDVFTTGSTLESCGIELFDKGISKLSVAVLAVG
jgi:ComF family protein